MKNYFCSHFGSQKYGKAFLPATFKTLPWTALDNFEIRGATSQIDSGFALASFLRYKRTIQAVSQK